MPQASTIKKPDEEEVKVEQIDIKKISVSKLNPRKVSKDDPGIKSLRESLNSIGLITPVVVRPDKGGKYELLAGQRRLMAARLNNWKTINCRIVDADDQQAAVIITTENLQRQDLTPFEQAQQIEDLMKRFDNNAHAVAAEIGRSPQWVARRAILLNLSDLWKQSLKESKRFKEFSAGHLELIARFDSDVQNDLLNELENNIQYRWNKYTIDELEVFLNDRMMLLKKAPFKTDDETLIPDVGACTNCQKRSSCQSLLFEPEEIGADEVEKNDKCLDRLCWDRKVNIFTAMQVAKYNEKYTDLVKISEAAYPQDKTALKNHEYSTCRKSEKGAVPAVLVDGKGSGKLRWIKPRGKIKTSQKVNDKKKPVSQKSKREIDVEIEDKTQRLEARRAAWVIKYIQEMFYSKMHKRIDSSSITKKTDINKLITPLIDDGEVAYPRSFFPSDDNKLYEIDSGKSVHIMKNLPTEVSIMALAITFGTIERHEFENDDHWILLDKLITLDAKTIFNELWKCIAPVLCHRLDFTTQDSALDKFHEAERICVLMGIDLKDIQKKAEEAIPQSKALQTLLKAKGKKQEKAAPGKKSKKKTETTDSSDEDAIYDEALKHSWAFANYEKRWDARRKTGLTDRELKEAITEEYGIEGWNTYSGLGCRHKGGKNPLLEITLKNGQMVTLKGKQLVDIQVRLVMDIPYPESTKKKTAKKTSRSLKAIADDLKTELLELEQRSGDRFSGTSAFTHAQKITVIYHVTEADGSERLTRARAEKYLKWLRVGNHGKASEME